MQCDQVSTGSVCNSVIYTQTKNHSFITEIHLTALKNSTVYGEWCNTDEKLQFLNLQDRIPLNVTHRYNKKL